MCVCDLFAPRVAQDGLAICPRGYGVIPDLVLCSFWGEGPWAWRGNCNINCTSLPPCMIIIELELACQRWRHPGT